MTRKNQKSTFFSWYGNVGTFYKKVTRHMTSIVKNCTIY